MKKLAIDLTEQEREIFSDVFYTTWNGLINFPKDIDSPTPWGHPWSFGSVEELTGDNVYEMAANWFNKVRYEMTCALEEEAQKDVE